MKVEIQNNEIVVRFSASKGPEKIQKIIDYLQYLELTSKCEYAENNLISLVSDIKKGRWSKVKKEIGFDD